MTYVVTGNCRRCRYTDCVVVCPVDCFHADSEMLYIDPNTRIECGACVAECPVDAIYDESELPRDQRYWLDINAERAPAPPVINQCEPELPTARERGRQVGC
ncbi:MAG: 4Fe-4S binding protein [Polyangiaceae bacterium]|nr:4Fe-4S binding protein [Polyangiaceae bacterium]